MCVVCARVGVWGGEVERDRASTGPSAQEQVGLVTPEGHRVVLLETLNEWVKIGGPDKGLKGWVPTDSVETVRLNTFRK